MESEVVEVDGGEVLFEWGPRSLRPDLSGSGQATAALLVQAYNHASDIPTLCISKTAPAATNRFIYYPDHLVRMPARDPARGMLGNIISNLTNIVNEPIFDGVITSILKEPYQTVRSKSLKDESVGDFVSRRFGKAVADNLLSALFHGIYAGDIYRLSARTLLPALWHLETRDEDGNGVLAELVELFFRQHSLVPYGPLEFRNRYLKSSSEPESHLFQVLSQASVYTFPLGLQQLSDIVVKRLTDNANITIKTNAAVTGVGFDQANRKFAVTTAASESSSPPPHTHDYLISSLSPAIMSGLLPTESKPSALVTALERSSNSATVLVVNLYYSSSSLDTIPDGFGYLLPRTVPIAQNPERALGVIFGSCTSGPRGDAAIRVREWVDFVDDDFKFYHKRIEDKEQKIHRELDAMAREADSSTLPEVEGLKDKVEALTTSLKEVVTTLAEAGRAIAQHNDPSTLQVRERVGQDTAPGTKLTVMIGGHWWSEWHAGDYPSEAEGIELAKSVLRRHLKIEEEPLIAKAKLQRDCIPQYQVGYRDDMAEIHAHFARLFEGRLKLIGPPWQGGVGVNDCVKRAREISTIVREGWDDKTGLEGFAEKEKWCLHDRRTKAIYRDPLS